MSIIIATLYLLIVIANSILGVSVLLINKKRLINRCFFYFILFGVGWIISLYLYYLNMAPDLILMIGRINFAFTILLIYYLFIFTIKLLRVRLGGVIDIILTLETAILTSLTVLTPLIIEDEIARGAERITKFGPIYSVFILHFAFYFLLTIILLFKEYRLSGGIQKMRIKIFGAGVFITVFMGSITNILLPYIFKFYKLQDLAPIYTIILILSMTYAITRYRFMDIRVFARAVTVYGVSLVAAVGSGLLLMSVATHYLPYSGAVMGPIVLIFGILIYEYVKNKFGRFANRYLFYPLYSAGETMAELSKKLSTFIDLGKLTFLTASTIKEVMKLDKVGLILKKPTPPRGQLRLLGMTDIEELYLAQNDGFNSEDLSSIFIKNKFLLHYLEKSSNPMIGDELESLAEAAKDVRVKKKILALKQYMEKIGAALCLPLLIEDRLIGVFVLGKKVSGDAYSSQDLGLLETLSHQIAVAVNNAQLYEQAQYFNQILRARVIQATKELAQAYKDLKKLDDSKTEFLSLASHQLRTPLSAVKGYISMVLEGDFGKLEPQTKEAMDRVYESNERLIRLVNDLLNVTRIEAGKMTYKPVKTDFAKLIQGVIDELKMTAENKKLKLEYTVGGKLPEVVIDPDKIREVVMNLVDNAIKYTEKGSVAVEAAKKGKEITVSVRDTGIGISKEKISSLFQWFSRGKGAIRLESGGFGLGLYIAKKIVERAGGKIWVESPGEGRGTSFYFSLPMEAPKENNSVSNNTATPVVKYVFRA